MRLLVEIASNDDAMYTNMETEIAACFVAVSAQIALGNFAGPLRDSNGNRVGAWSLDLTEERE